MTMQTTLQIQEGRCYRTRNGRKVGPIQRRNGNFQVNCWTAPGGHVWDDAGSSGTWFGDGSLTGNDLVAEWSDEPAVRTTIDISKIKPGDTVVARFVVEANSVDWVDGLENSDGYSSSAIAADITEHIPKPREIVVGDRVKCSHLLCDLVVKAIDRDAGIAWLKCSVGGYANEALSDITRIEDPTP